MQSSAARWKELVKDRWGPITTLQVYSKHHSQQLPRISFMSTQLSGSSSLQVQAAELAGGWKKLYACKAAVREFCPSRVETQAALNAIIYRRSQGLACCALIDGSGSMCGGRCSSRPPDLMHAEGSSSQLDISHHPPVAGDFDSMTSVVGQLAETLLEDANAQARQTASLDWNAR